MTIDNIMGVHSKSSNEVRVRDMIGGRYLDGSTEMWSHGRCKKYDFGNNNQSCSDE